MKLIGVMNGWRDAPHHWWRYLLLPLGRVDHVPGSWWSISLFGLVLFFETTGAST